ncbi:Uncharacterised protein [Slackia heliotrinireducens]|uniref:DUF6273 domain-containing protein n=1 Tax=Slackia heliotrinireducens (strain ATCC 29202 / DSM 20476 / NCTC 11029 / RHS 1) TaxID=471855 RepID=C7N139_SLAHD|nr:DUF6273 domain-containing protein [Slackia heliotrinireducens]ACV23261.1 hypothetical protein Shel_22510 [Slackia heliotrinireducens DSM 20476]VEH02414.1 Uncharacterised protein [Slackia heliotrinireducens]
MKRFECQEELCEEADCSNCPLSVEDEDDDVVVMGKHASFAPVDVLRANSPVVELDPEPPAASEPEAEPEATVKPEPAAEPEPVVEPAHAVESVREPEYERESESEPVPVDEPEPEPESEPVDSAEPEPESELEAMSGADTELGADLEAEPESAVDSTPELVTASRPEPESEAEPEPEAEVEPEPKPAPEPAPEPKPAPETEPEPAPEPEEESSDGEFYDGLEVIDSASAVAMLPSQAHNVRLDATGSDLLGGGGNPFRFSESPDAKAAKRFSRANHWLIGALGVALVAAVALAIMLGSARSQNAQLQDDLNEAQATLSAIEQEQEAAAAAEAEAAAAEEQAAAEAEAPAVEVRDSVDDYSWDELSELSTMISEASSDADAIALAAEYHLCAKDGTLDGSQVKHVTLEDGTEASVCIVGFRHDQKHGAAGTAGITFQFVDSVSQFAMNDYGTNYGGWADSDMRSWLNSEMYLRLPSDLRNVVVEVEKATNNEGSASDRSCVSITSDKLWLLSLVEIIGISGEEAYWACDIFNVEGSQYPLYEFTGINAFYTDEQCASIVKNFDGYPASWWLRSSRPGSGSEFYYVTSEGIPDYAQYAGNYVGVAPCFCV